MASFEQIMKKTGRALSSPLAERYFTPVPPYLFLEVIRRCTHRCTMCNIWQDATDGLSMDEIRRIFSASFFDNTERVILTGGEPTLRRDLPRISEFMLRQFPKLRMMAILTTGFGSERITKMVGEIIGQMESDPRKPRLVVQVSFDGIGDTYNRIRNISKAWDQTLATLESLKLLRDRGTPLDLMLHAVIQPLNVHELDHIDAYAKSLNIPILYSLAVISETYFGNTGLGERLALTESEAEIAKNFLSRPRPVLTPEMPLYYADLANMLDGGQRGRRCMMGYYMMYVRMDGKVYPCVNSGDHVLGDLLTQTPDEIWFGQDANQKRATVRRDFCPSCPSACYSDITGVKELLTAAKHKVQRWLKSEVA